MNESYLRIILGLLILTFVAVSGESSSNREQNSPQRSRIETKKEDAKNAATKNKTTTIVFVGDSLTEGYGVHQDEAYPALVENRLRQLGHNVKVVNAGVSGSLSSSAPSRVRWLLKTEPDILVLALGANDGLKGTPPETVKKNLREAIDLAHDKGVKVVLAGVQVFANLGPEYTRQFAQIYPDLAKEKNVALIPFLLQGVALQKELNLSDGKHPNAAGHKIIAQTVSDSLAPLL